MNGVALLTDGFDLTSRSVTDFGNLALRQVATVGTLEEPLADLSTRVVLESAPSQLSQLFVALLSRHECDPGPVVWNFKGIATHDDQVARIFFSSLALGQHRATVDELSTELGVGIRVLESERWLLDRFINGCVAPVDPACESAHIDQPARFPTIGRYVSRHE